MKRYLLAALVVCLLATPALAANGRGAVAYRMAPAGVVFPCYPYTNIWQIYEADGKVIVNQPAGEVGLNLTVIIRHCQPGQVYRVDESGPLTWGCYVPGTYWWKPIGEIVADENGDGSFHLQRAASELGEGLGVMSIWVNRKDVDKTILISEPFPVVGR